ncbi:MAG TPA: carbohydrate ABC transporter permease [Symbiobacteriaceae bacterium]|jgi:multiple sugar transport system permease protein
MLSLLRKRFSRFLIFGGLVGVAVILIFPMLWIVSASFKTPADLFSRATLLPVDENGHFYISLQNYKQALAYLKFGLWVRNTLIVAITVNVIGIFFNTLAAYAFARLRFPFRDGIFKTLLIPMMVPGTVTLVPTFLLVKWFGWLDSLHGLIWPGIVWIGTVFLFRQQFLSIPRDLEDAAKIDGANWFLIYWNVGLPAVRPMLVTSLVFGFLGSYNDFFWPSVVLMDPKKYTLALGLASLMGSAEPRNYQIKLATAVMISLPMILVFLPFQKQLSKGFIAGALK